MKKLVALICAVVLLMSSAMYASADTTYTLSGLDLYQDGSPYFGSALQYDSGIASLTMNIDRINQYYSENYCNLRMIYQKQQLFGDKTIYDYTKTWYTGSGGYSPAGTQSSGKYYYTFDAIRNGLHATNVTMKHFN